MAFEIYTPHDKTAAFEAIATTAYKIYMCHFLPLLLVPDVHMDSKINISLVVANGFIFEKIGTTFDHEDQDDKMSFD